MSLANIDMKIVQEKKRRQIDNQIFTVVLVAKTQPCNTFELHRDMFSVTSIFRTRSWLVTQTITNKGKCHESLKLSTTPTLMVTLTPFALRMNEEGSSSPLHHVAMSPVHNMIGESMILENNQGSVCLPELGWPIRMSRDRLERYNFFCLVNLYLLSLALCRCCLFAKCCGPNKLATPTNHPRPCWNACARASHVW
jgi:hypothetical protein